MKNFEDFSLSPLLKTNLAREGFTVPTLIQAMAIEPALAGSDLVATAQTGSGKTLAFVLPLIHALSTKKYPAGVRAVILAPTRELAMQIDQAFAKMAAGSGVRTALVVGGVGEGPQIQAIRKGAQVVIATAGRLYDYLSRRLVDLAGVRILVLDEADRMLDMGFLPTIERIMAPMPADKQILLFSATLESSVKGLVNRYVPNGIRLAAGSSDRPTEQVDLQYCEVEQHGKFELLETMLGREEGSFLVFSRTRRGAERLSKRLAEQGVKVTAIHGDRSQNQRNQALKGFQDGRYRVLVATDVAARGIHVDGISHVVNYDLPQAPEDFIHRVGRTGRAGARGTAWTFGTRAERSDVARIERALSINLGPNAMIPPVAPVTAIRMVAAGQRRTASFGPRRRMATRRVS